MSDKNITIEPVIKTALENLNNQGEITLDLLGLPAKGDEEWKYVPVQLLDPQSFTEAVKPSGKINKLPVELPGSIRIVLRNGFFDANSSSSLDSLNGLEIFSLAQETDPTGLAGAIASSDGKSFVSLNDKFCRDGIVIRVPKKFKSEKPVHIAHIIEPGDEATLISPRILVIAEQGSQVTIAETYSGKEHDASDWINSVSEIVVRENANVKYIKVELDSHSAMHTDFTQVMQDANSTFDIVSVTLGGKMVRNNLHVKHNGQNCTTHLYGLYVADGDQLIDNHTLVDHALPNCFSNELYKGVIGGKATGVFNGKIFVRKDAQKTNAYQSNKTILLTDDAQMNAKPQLEIFADDVKCTHGATTGQLDEEALFYLRARGIGEQSARIMLNIAFAQDVLNNIPEGELRDHLTELVTEKLSGNS